MTKEKAIFVRRQLKMLKSILREQQKANRKLLRINCKELRKVCKREWIISDDEILEKIITDNVSNIMSDLRY